MLSVVVLIPTSTIFDTGQLPLSMSIIPFCTPSQGNQSTLNPGLFMETCGQAAASSPLALWRGCHLGPELESLFCEPTDV